MTGDTVFKKVEDPENLIMKIDVEGYEKKVLKGFNKTLQKFRPLVIMEFLPEVKSKNRFTSHEELLKFLPTGYQVYKFSKYDRMNGEYSIVPLEDISQEKFSNQMGSTISRNIILCPSELANKLPKLS
jgi:Methyltransferase FkbM domain